MEIRIMSHRSCVKQLLVSTEGEGEEEEEEDVVVVAAAAAACNPSRRIPAAWKGVKNEKGNKLRHLTNLLIHLDRDT